jgi:hypothetical protein
MIVSDESAVARLLALRDAVIDPSAMIPAPVFRVELDEFCWLEFGDVLTGAFFRCLTQLALYYGDREIIVSCGDPHALENYGHSGVAVFSPSDSVDAYHAFLDADCERSSINARNIEDRLFFLGDSGGWAFAADRSVELAIGGQRATGNWPIVKDLRYQTFDGMLDLAAGPFWHRRLPDDVRAAYERNYRARSWKIDRFVEG